MPRQQINYPRPDLTQVDPATGVETPVPLGQILEVHWDGNHGTVQASMSIDTGLLQRVLEQERRADGEMPTRVWFYTEALTRPDLQRLIKTARRARDDAFGADE